MIKRLLLVSLVAGLFVSNSACTRPGPTPSLPTGEGELTGEISIAGSTTVQPLAERLAAEFTAIHPRVRITVQGGGSSTGIKSAGQGTVNIGTASREVKDEEMANFPNLKVFPIARDAIAIVTHPDIPLDGITLEQARGIFAGKINNWKEVGGPDAYVIVVAREEGSGTRAAFEEIVMREEALITATAIFQPSNGAIRTTVSTTPHSIGFLSFGYLSQSVKPLAINGVALTKENASNGAYPIVRSLNMLTNGEPKGLVKLFLDYVLSPEGQAVVEEEGYIAVQ